MDSFELLFESLPRVDAPTFMQFAHPQLALVDFEGVSFLALMDEENPYAEGLSGEELSVTTAKGEYRFRHAFMAHRQMKMEQAAATMHLKHVVGSDFQGATARALELNDVVVGGVASLHGGGDTYVIYRPVYSQRDETPRLVGLLAAVASPSPLLQRLVDEYRIGAALSLDGKLLSSQRCCDKQSGWLLPVLEQTYAYELMGKSFELTCRSPVSWQQLPLKGAVLAFLFGLLLTLFAYRSHLGNLSRTAMLLERNSIIRRQVDEQTRALRQANTQLEQERAALDEHAIVSIADTAGNITYVNEKFCEISGYSSEELLGRNHRIVKSQRHPPEFYEQMWHTISQGKVWHGVICNRASNGDEYWVNSTIVPFFDERGLPYQYVSIRTDITPIVEVEAALAQREQEVASILDTVPALIWYKDRDSRIVRANRAAAELVGVSPEEMAGRHHSDFFPPDMVKRLRADDLKVLESAKPLCGVREELQIEDKPHYFRVDRVPFLDENSEVSGLIVIAYDVTTQEETEQALLVNEERLRRSQTFANIGTWDWNIQNGDLFWSERIAPLFGYEVGELETTYDNFLNAVHPDDRELVSSAVGACVEQGIEYNIEHRVVWPDGSVRWLSEKGDVVRDAEGKPLHMLGVVQDIHVRKMAEAALAESEEKFRNLYEMSPVGIALNEMDGSFVEANQGFLDMIGYTADECRQLTYWQLTPEEYSAQEAAQLESLSTTGRYGPYEKEYIHKDGHRVGVLLNGTIIRDRDGNQRIWSIVQDITERKQAEEALNRFKSTLDVTKDCVFMFEPSSLKFFYVNQGAMEQIGYSEAELMEMTPVDIKPEYDEPLFRELLTTMLKGERDSLTFETLHQHKDGHTIPVEISLQYVEPEGESARFVAIVRNITERKAMQEKLLEAKEAAEQASKAKSEFLSSMSHELRTPLNAIIGFTQLMEGDENLTADQHDNLMDISNAGSHLLELINDVLDLAKIEAGKMELSIDNVALSGVMVAAKNLIAPMAEKHGLQLTFDGDCFGSAHVRADFTRIKQVLLNLLSNAVKYNRENGSIHVACEPGESGRMRISVRDSGEGIPEVKRKGLFEAFNRLDAEGSNIEGTGIGLVITRQLVELMGGEIGVDSVVGEGSTFWFELMLGEQSHQGEAAPATATQSDAGLGAGRRVLYIEDNPVNLKLVSKLIDKRTAIELLSAEEPVGGIELALEHRPDLILLDINLPEMSGYEVLRHLRDMAETKDIPVVALSANAMAEDLKKGEEAGFDGYLTKPINVKEFLAVLEQMLG